MAQRKVYIQTKLSKAHLEGIGRVAATWSNLESCLIYCVAVVAGIDPKLGAAMLTPASSQAWLHILVRVGMLSDEFERHVPALEECAKKIDALGMERNDVVHTYWGDPGVSEPPKGEVLGLALKKKGHATIKPVVTSPLALRRLCRRIEAAEAELRDLVLAPPEVRQLVSARLIRAKNLRQPPRQRKLPLKPSRGSKAPQSR